MFMTVCIPSFNRGYILDRTLKSLSEQTDKDFETLLIDDGSTDNTQDIAYKYIDSCNLTYYKKQGGGKHTALNVGIEKARGDYFIILDSDDCLDTKYVERIKSIVFSEHYQGLKNKVCGVIGKCSNIETGEIIGELFEKECISYIDMHFSAKKYGDCCECIKTAVLKQYRWPEPQETRFVPESYVFDKIGMKYELFCCNDIFEYKEYLVGGITKQGELYQRKNIVGYLYNYVSKLEEIFPYCQKISLLKRISMWRLYWNAVAIDKECRGPRVKKVTILGLITKMLLPVLNKIKK